MWYMLKVLLVLLIMFGIEVLVIFLYKLYKGYQHLKQETRGLEQALEDQFILQAESFDTYLSMLRAACREGDPWDDQDSEKR